MKDGPTQILGGGERWRENLAVTFLYQKIKLFASRILSSIFCGNSYSLSVKRAPHPELGWRGAVAGKNRRTFLYHKILILQEKIPA
ncbi:hypothetical protein A0128_12190 [Leptospira tipperaryensis]|uniref:Uncharacterized protein n=1 Tax=Leptospira tipperaryensis TaxID=2564040 RepID=A0A1D7UY89_9LEPT|nr:hypothetical protein A0128_12190 [Leptospira tipperaryensis]